MVNPHAYRQKAAGLALDRGLYDVASYIMELDLSRFRHGTPVDVCLMLAGRLKPPKQPNNIKPL